MKITRVRIANVEVPVYFVPKKGVHKWEVRTHIGGRGHTQRKTFTDRLVGSRRIKGSGKRAALAYAREMAVRMVNCRNAWRRLSDQEAYACELALERLRPFAVQAINAQGKANPPAHTVAIQGLALLESAVAKWIDSTLVETKARLADSPAVAAVVQEFIGQKRRQNLSAYHLRDLEIRLGKFASAFKLPVNRVGAAELEAWLASLKVNPRTWNNYRAALVGFFAYAKERKYLPADWSALDSVKRIELHDAEPAIYKPSELRRIIEAATPESFRILLAISAFAGIRSEELSKLQWEDFDWSAGYIFLRKKIVKGKASQKKQRQVPIPENLVEWLSPYQESKGPVSPYKNPKVVAGMKIKLAEKLGIKWSKNALRKSWISYQLALTQDAGKVARWAGNSPSIISGHYERLVTPAMAHEWFEIRPQTVSQGILKLQFR